MQMSQRDVLKKLGWLMAARVGIALCLLAGAVFFQHQEVRIFSVFPARALYVLGILMLFFSLLYALWYGRTRRPRLFAFVQLLLDVVMVTGLIWVTGGYESLLSFLYLLVIINASIILSRRESFLIAAFSAILFGVLVDLEYYGILPSFAGNPVALMDRVKFWSVFLRILVTTVACFSVSILTSFLSVQLRRAREEMRHMGSYVKRMESLAMAGEMAAGLAHEIKNPLASLRGAIELLETEICKDADSVRLMRIIRRESDRLSNLVTEFLFFAKPGKGSPEPLDVAALIHETVQIQEENVRSRGRIQYRLRLSPDIWVEADPDRLRQVLWNLLLNATESISGEGEVRIFLDREKDRMARIVIQDTGCGIQEDKLSLIFDPFYTTKANGTGLGLSIAVRILDAMGGRLHAESRPGEGSTFTILLPRMTGFRMQEAGPLSDG